MFLYFYKKVEKLKNIRMKYIIPALVILLSAFAQTARAEFILMKDGTVLEGEVVIDFFNYSVVDFKLKDGTKKVLYGKDIEKIYPDDDFKIKRTITKKDGTILEGYMVYEGWFRYLIKKELANREEIEIAKSDIKSVDPAIKIKSGMRPEIIAKKKDSWYFTGVPVIAYSSDNGFRGGARVYFYNNGERDEEYFDKTPYGMQTYAQFTASTTGLIEGHINFDYQHVGGTWLRIKSVIEYEKNPNANYFGTGNKTTANNLTDVNGTSYQKFSQYEDYLYRNNYQYYKFNKYEYQMPKFSIDFIGDFGFPIKPLLGYQFKWSEIKSWDGKGFKINGNEVSDKTVATTSLLSIEKPLGFNGDVGGVTGGITSFVRAGVAFDTRDFEPDPHEGFLIDYAFEGATFVFGSQYNYFRNTFGFRFYTTWLNTLTLAVRLGYVASSDGIPFYEMGYFGFLFDRQEGLGGEKTVRGYQQYRFIGKGMTLANIELRYRFIDFILFNQRFAFKLLAFVDAGNAYTDAVEAFSKPRFLDYKLAYGVGGLFTWNQASVMHLYVGFSQEDIYFSLNFSQAF